MNSNVEIVGVIPPMTAPLASNLLPSSPFYQMCQVLNQARARYYAKEGSDMARQQGARKCLGEKHHRYDIVYFRSAVTLYVHMASSPSAYTDS